MNVEQIVALIGVVGGLQGIIEMIKYFYNRKQEKRIVEATAVSDEAKALQEKFHLQEMQLEMQHKEIANLHDQLEHMNAQIGFKDSRIETLLTRNDEQYKKYTEQTERLRKTQDKLFDISSKLTELEKSHGELEVKYIQHVCKRINCLKRQPQNDWTRLAIELAGENSELMFVDKQQLLNAANNDTAKN